MIKIPIVTAYTPLNKVILTILRGLMRVLSLFVGKTWATPPPYFHDDPRHYTFKDIVFFAYKYYFKPPSKSENTEGVENFFQDHPPIFSLPNLPVQSTVTITAAGDLMPYEWIQQPYCTHLWDDIADDFFSSDICFANLETPIDPSKPASLVPEMMLSHMLFNGDKQMFDIFNGQNYQTKTVKNKGFDILSTANNHSLDMGEQGVEATIDFLKERNILHVGTSKNDVKHGDFSIIERNDIKIAFISYTFSMNQFTNPSDKKWLVNHLEVNQAEVDLSILKQDVANAKAQNADFIVLSLHYGNAYQAYPGVHIVENTKRIFEECGVDVILGTHAHNVQPMAAYPFTCPHTGVDKRGFVIFSMSDFIAYDIFNACHLSVYLKLTLSKMASKTENTEGVSSDSHYVILTDVKAIPVYACGNYFSREKRDLRLLNAYKTVDLIEKKDIPSYMTAWNVRELTGLMAFYKSFFQKNIPS